MSRVFDGFFLVLALISIGVVYSTAHIDSDLLGTLTKEMGFYENISVIILLCIGAYGAIFFFKNRGSLDRVALFFIPAFSLLGFIAAFEEISWGQHILNFQSTEYFIENNHQKETNIHNLIDGNIFSSVIYFVIYTFFVFMPALFTIFPKLLTFLPESIVPSIKTSLIILFGSTFQLYFYDDFGVLSDMITLIVGFVLFGVVLLLHYEKIALIYFGFGVFSMVSCMMHHELFGFYNMQYEIREMFVMLGVFYWFVEATANMHRAVPARE
jgi:hypothetical protein